MMNIQHIQNLSSKTALLDTNLLTVLLVGQLGKGCIEKNKKTRNYTRDDFILLTNLIKNFKDIITTPHILAETVNLIDWVQGEHRQILFTYLQNFINTTTEHYLSAKTICQNPAFIKLGLTDSGLLELCKLNNMVLITADFSLYIFGLNYGLEVVNFNHIRNEFL